MTEVPRREKLLKVATADLMRSVAADVGHQWRIDWCRTTVESISALCVQDARDAILGELKAKLNDRLRRGHVTVSVVMLLEILEEL